MKPRLRQRRPLSSPRLRPRTAVKTGVAQPPACHMSSGSFPRIKRAGSFLRRHFRALAPALLRHHSFVCAMSAWRSMRSNCPSTRRDLVAPTGSICLPGRVLNAGHRFHVSHAKQLSVSSRWSGIAEYRSTFPQLRFSATSVPFVLVEGQRSGSLVRRALAGTRPGRLASCHASFVRRSEVKRSMNAE